VELNCISVDCADPVRRGVKSKAWDERALFLVGITILIVLTGCSDSESDGQALPSDAEVPRILDRAQTTEANSPGETQFAPATTDARATTTDPPSTTSSDPTPTTAQLPYADEGQSVMLFTEDEPSTAPGNLLHLGLVVAPGGDEVALVPPMGAATRLYVAVPRQHTGCAQVRSIDITTNESTVWVDLRVGPFAGGPDFCIQPGVLASLLPLEIPGGIGDREIVKVGCEEPENDKIGCSGLQGSSRREDLPLVKSQLIDCTPNWLVQNVHPRNRERISFCDDEQLAESFAGYGDAAVWSGEDPIVSSP